MGQGPRSLGYRLRVPLIIVGVAAAASCVLAFTRRLPLMRDARVFGIYLVLLAALLALFGWLLFGRWARWRTRAVVLLAVVAGAWLAWRGLVREVELDGDLVPTLRFRWEAARSAPQSERPASTPPTARAKPSSEFPEYRGPKRDGVVPAVPLGDWQSRPPRIVWSRPVGEGYAAVAVAGELAVTIEQRGEEEAVVAYDASTGRERWVHAYSARFDEFMGGPGPRATPTIADRDVLSLGAQGDLVCLEADSGTVRWAVNILEENDTANLPWGMAGSPLVVEGAVIVTPGCNGPSGSESRHAGLAGLAAYDRRTGQRIWATGSHPGAYSSPMLATLAGRQQILIFDGSGLAGHDPATGAELWRFPWSTHERIHVAQPLVLENDRVLISSGYNVGAALIEIRLTPSGWQAAQLWKSRALRCKFSSPVASGAHVFGLDDGFLTCLEIATGRQCWRAGRYGHGQLLLCGGHLLVFSERGQLALVAASPDDFRELGRIEVFEGGKNWNPPAMAGSRLFLRNHRQMACLELRPE